MINKFKLTELKTKYMEKISVCLLNLLILFAILPIYNLHNFPKNI